MSKFAVGAGLIHYWNGSFLERNVLGTPLRELSSEQYAVSIHGMGAVVILLWVQPVNI